MVMGSVKSLITILLTMVTDSYDSGCHFKVPYMTVYIEVRAFISYKSFLTRRLNETGVNLDPGVYFLLATR